jgi:AraC family transcriptional regulator
MRRTSAATRTTLMSTTSNGGRRVARPRDKASPMLALLSRMPPLGKTVVASTLSAGWKHVHGVILDGRVEDFFDYSSPFPIVSFNLKGVTRVEWKRKGRYSRFLAKPGDVLVTPPGDGNALRTNLPNEGFSCLIDPALLQGLAEQEWNAAGPRVEIVESFTKSDGEMWSLGQRMAAQLRRPVSASRLYAETLYTQITIHLLWNHSSLPRKEPNQADRLDDERLRRAIDYIHDTLGDDVSLHALADVAGLSPNYFLGAFKQATGRTPHRYVIEQRIAKACTLLHDPHRSITEVSLAVGFSSQSHLTEAFRRFMKTTPAAYRKEILGLARDSGGPDS